MRELKVVGLMPTKKLSKVEGQVFDLAVKRQRFRAARNFRAATSSLRHCGAGSSRALPRRSPLPQALYRSAGCLQGDGYNQELDWGLES